MGSFTNVATLSTYLYAVAAMARPAFLLGMFPLYSTGVAVAGYEGYDLRFPVAVLGLVLVWTVQLMTHYNNEYWDVETDAAMADGTLIAGGSNVLVTGVIPRAMARVAALATLVLAVLLTLAMTVVLDVGSGVLVFAGTAIAVGWFYSAPPLALASRGAGEAAVALITGGLVPATAYYLQASTVSTALWVVCLPFLPLAFAASMATALPDVDAD